ncbi:MAG: UDP-N-acetylmuramoyl-L-alanine--D-glutamate ligase, partial [Eggerthellaceae bacterium]|nr:UDP-N-acetylmuramoyl-L-alanine--D-glutamate ligase [Eggerthellaceae bacterium]
EGRRLVVLLGGQDKGTALGELVGAVSASCKAAVCFGAAGERFSNAFTAAQGSQGVDILRADHLEGALDAALSYAQAGDIVLLSPACASFDEFEDFEQRGTVFKEMVAQRSAVQGV